MFAKKWSATLWLTAIGALVTVIGLYFAIEGYEADALLAIPFLLLGMGLGMIFSSIFAALGIFVDIPDSIQYIILAVLNTGCFTLIGFLYDRFKIKRAARLSSSSKNQR